MAVATHKISTTFCLPRKLRDDVSEFCEKTGAPMAEVVRRALAAYLDQHKEKEAA